MRKGVCLLLLLLVCGGLCTGCWDQDEITSLAVISAIGLDAGDRPGEFLLTVQGSPSSSSGQNGPDGGGSQLRVVSVQAESVLEGVHQLQSRLRREPFLLHLSFVVIGESLARSGIAGVVAGLQGTLQIRGSVPVFVAAGSAETVLRAHSVLGQGPGQDVSDLLENAASFPVGRRTTINEVIGTLENHGKELAISILDLAPLDLEASSNQADDGTGQSGEQYAEVVLARIAIFRRDRWVETLDRFETNTLVLLLGEAAQGVSAVVSPSNPNSMLAVEYERFRADYTVATNGVSPPAVLVKPRVSSRLLEVPGGHDLQAAGLQPIEEAVEFDLGQHISQLVSKLQTAGSDALGFGQMISRHDPQAWSHLEPIWEQVFPQVAVQVQPRVIVRTTSLLKKFFQLKP